ncbi:hypothetical protein Bbelb_277980 [Branchiostoma belcheri]|nr:hypothetical protein Bbelb_277980 [Branchiostoma belcheri]
MPATRSQRRSGGGAADDPPPAVTTVSRKQPKKPKKPTAAGQIKDIQAQLSALTSVTETLQQSLATIAARPPAPPAPPHPTLPPAPHPTLPPAHLENLQPPPTDSLVSNILGRPFPARIPEYGPSPNPCPATPAAARIGRTVTDLLSSALAPSTLRAYRQAWQLFRNFTIDVLGEDLATPPVSTNLLAQFIGFLHNEGFAPPTISSKLSAISFVHKLLELPDPAQSFFIQKLLHATRKSHPPDNRRPITPSILKSLIDSLPEVYAPAYDRQLYKAMFLFTFYSLARVGEVTVTGSSHHTLQLSDVNLQSTSHQTVPPLLITFRTYKHSSTKRPVTVSIVPHPGSSYCPVANLKSYLSLRGECAGCLFLLSDGRPVSSDHFSNTLRKCLERAHLDPQAYTAHSFRIGAATHAASSGASDAQLRALGRWSSDAFKSYIRP